MHRRGCYWTGLTAHGRLDRSGPEAVGYGEGASGGKGAASYRSQIRRSRPWPEPTAILSGAGPKDAL